MVGKTDLDALMNFGEEDNSSSFTPNWVKFSLDGEKERTYQIRICPPTEGNTLPMRKERIYYVKYNGKQLVGAVEGNDVFADVFFKSIKLAKELDNAAVLATVRKLRPKDKYYFNVINRAEGRVQVMGVPETAFEMIKDALQTQVTYGRDATDPEEGLDLFLKIKRDPKNFAPHLYASVNVAPETSEIGVEGWEEQLFDLAAMARSSVITTEEMLSNMNEILGDHSAIIREMYKKAGGKFDWLTEQEVVT